MAPHRLCRLRQARCQMVSQTHREFDDRKAGGERSRGGEYGTAGDVHVVHIVRTTVPVDDTAARVRIHSGSAHVMPGADQSADRKSTRLNSSHANISYAVFCL